jgi:hypothetical protein
MAKKKNIIEKEIEEVEEWIIERRKFFRKLGFVVILVGVLMLVGSFL